jgi:hypothetical protein
MRRWRWLGRIDFEAMKVHIRRQIVLVGGAVVLQASEGGAGRWVPLPRGTAAVVKAG